MILHSHCPLKSLFSGRYVEVLLVNIAISLLTTLHVSVEAFDRVSLSADMHITLLQKTSNDLLHVVQVIRSLDLYVLIVIAFRVIIRWSFVVGKLQITV